MYQRLCCTGVNKWINICTCLQPNVSQTVRHTQWTYDDDCVFLFTAELHWNTWRHVKTSLHTLHTVKSRTFPYTLGLGYWIFRQCKWATLDYVIFRRYSNKYWVNLISNHKGKRKHKKAGKFEVRLHVHVVKYLLSLHLKHLMVQANCIKVSQPTHVHLICLWLLWPTFL